MLLHILLGEIVDLAFPALWIAAIGELAAAVAAAVRALHAGCDERFQECLGRPNNSGAPDGSGDEVGGVGASGGGRDVGGRGGRSFSHGAGVFPWGRAPGGTAAAAGVAAVAEGHLVLVVGGGVWDSVD